MPAAPQLSPAAPRPRPEAAPPLARIALLGNPNTGKTTVFNRLCGALAKTANFPGTTTDARFGRTSVGEGRPVEVGVIDLPGIYRLSLDSPEATICRAALHGDGLDRPPDAAVVVVDATNLSRNLMLVGELLPYGLPLIVALNMVDLAQRRGLTLDAASLSRHLGCRVVAMVARRGEGMPELRRAIDRVLKGELDTAPTAEAPFDRADFPALDAWADAVVEASVGGSAAVGSATDTLTERLDQAFTHPVLGLFVFGVVMAGLFWVLFALARLPMDLIEATFKHLGDWVGSTLPPGPVRELLADGVIGGIAGTIVFLPQICLLFFLISLLEDTGYLARAAFVMDRVLYRFGLPGHAFVPLLSSHACALPGIMATKLIPDRRDRLATILVAPLMSCSARLPVYVLLTSLLFAHRPLLAGLAFAACYLLGAGAALLTALVARRTVLRGVARPMMLELPSYKPPSLRNAFLMAKDQGFAFLRTAGTIIMAICIVMWWLSAYPHSAPPPAATALRQQAAVAATPEAAADLSEQARRLEARSAEANSFAGRIGRAVQPVFAPLGYDWQLTVGVLTSFLAREVFVSTMSVLLAGSADADVHEQGVMETLRSAKRDDGRPVFTTATAASLLVFFALAMQCLSTLIVTRRETGSWKWAAVQLGYMSGLAYVCAFLTFHGLRLFGIG